MWGWRGREMGIYTTNMRMLDDVGEAVEITSTKF